MGLGKADGWVGGRAGERVNVALVYLVLLCFVSLVVHLFLGLCRFIFFFSFSFFSCLCLSFCLCFPLVLFVRCVVSSVQLTVQLTRK